MDNDAKTLLATLWAGGQYAYYWTAPDKISYWFPVDKIPHYPNCRQNVYFGINPVGKIPPQNAQGEPAQPQCVRSQNDYISAVNCLFCEFDFKDFGNADTIRQHLKQFPFPSVVVLSGGGVHCYFLLQETFTIASPTDRQRIITVQANWVNFIGGDKQSKDLARVLRVPGTKNYKPQYAPHFPTVTIAKANYQRRYSLDYLEELSKPAEITPPEPLSPPIGRASCDDVLWFGQRALNAACEMIRGAADGEKHSTLLKAARLLGGYVAGGILCEAEAIRILEFEISHKPHVDNQDAARRTIQSGLEYGKAFPITLEQKQAEREQWRRQQGQPVEAAVLVERDYWGKRYGGFWERARA